MDGANGPPAAVPVEVRVERRADHAFAQGPTGHVNQPGDRFSARKARVVRVMSWGLMLEASPIRRRWEKERNAKMTVRAAMTEVEDL